MTMCLNLKQMSKWVFVVMSIILYNEVRVGHTSKFRNELKFMQCICTSTIPERLQKMQCMERFVAPKNAFRFYQAVQYCGYFAYKTRFGATMRQGENIPDYNPWEYSPDLQTERSCSNTRYWPGQKAPVKLHLVTAKGWVLAKCMLNMAQVQDQSTQLLQTCCWNS